MSDAVLTQEFVRRLRGFIRRRVRTDDEADEIAQEVMLKFVRHQEGIAPGRGPAWLFTVARREIVTRFRRSGRPAGELPDDQPAAAGPPEPSAVQELAHCVQPLLEGLPAADRDLLRRVDLAGESQARLADELHLARSTVKARVQRARQRFHEALAACCVVALDARGIPVSYASRGASACGCAGEPRPAPPCGGRSTR